MLRISVYFIVAIIVFFPEAHACLDELGFNENLVIDHSLKLQKLNNRRNTNLKRKVNDYNIFPLNDLTNTLVKKRKPNSSGITRNTEPAHLNDNILNYSPSNLISIFSPLKKDSPTTAELKYFSIFRPHLVKEEYTSQNAKKSIVLSPQVRRIYKEYDPGNYWSRSNRVKGKVVYQADFLFDPHAKVLTDGKWKTNLERMKSGLCPIGHKGIVDKKERKMLTAQEIEARQKKYRIELHHFTQKDTGTDADPIGEMSHVGHMGKNARFIIEFDAETKVMNILHSNLEKEKAVELCQSDQFIVTNLLHFRKDSLINKAEWDAWRKTYWKNRADEIEKGIFIGKENLPTHVICKKLFSTPVKEKTKKYRSS